MRTRQISLVKSYAGTTIDEVMRVGGGYSRVVLNPFPPKSDVLLALGSNSRRAGDARDQGTRRGAFGWTAADLETWVAQFPGMLDEHGSFSFAWTQAANEHEEIRLAGIVGHLQPCERLGAALGRLAPVPPAEATEPGLAVFAMLERAWAYSRPV